MNLETKLVTYSTFIFSFTTRAIKKKRLCEFSPQSDSGYLELSFVCVNLPSTVFLLIYMVSFFLRLAPLPLCLDNETLVVEPIVKVTFGSGVPQFSSATPADFDFETTYEQDLTPPIEDGNYTFVNEIYNHYNNAWHTGAKDHTGDQGGYMFLVNAGFEPGVFYKGSVSNLCPGLRYEFSVYLANLCQPSGRLDPSVRFQVRSADDDDLLIQLDTGLVPKDATLTWRQYGFSFITPSSSVNLYIISNTPGGNGNDIVIDDIELRVCTLTKGNGICVDESIFP